MSLQNMSLPGVEYGMLLEYALISHDTEAGVSHQESMKSYILISMLLVTIIL